MNEPLYSLEIEQALLGAVLVNQKILDDLDVEPEHFIEPVHDEIFDACVRLHDCGRTVNPYVLKKDFADHPDLQDLGGFSYLVRLAASAATIVNAPDYARTIRDYYLKRRLQQAALDIQGLSGKSPADESAADLIEKAEALIHEVRGMTPDAEGPADAETLAQRFAESLEDEERGLGIPTGLRGLDNLTGGLHQTDLTFIAGRPGMGKSLLLTDIFLSLTLEGYHCPFFSLEMSADQILARMASSHLHRQGKQIPYQAVRTRKWNEYQKADFTKAVMELRRLPFYIFDKGGQSLHDIRSRLKRLKRHLEKKGEKLGPIFVDYLQLINLPGIHDKYSKVSEISAQSKQMAKEFDVPLVMAAQLSRRPEQRDNKRPLMSDLRDSGGIEQDADNIIFLYRHEYYLANEEPEPGTAKHYEWKGEMENCRGKIEIILSKQRSGEAQKIIHGDINLATNRVTT